MQVRDIMTPNPITVRPDVSLAAARDLLGRRHLTMLPVVEAGHVVGILEASSLLIGDATVDARAATDDEPDRWGGLPGWEEGERTAESIVTDVMRRHPIPCIASDADVEVAASQFASSGSRQLLVIDDGSLVGILSTSDLVRATAARNEPQTP